MKKLKYLFLHCSDTPRGRKITPQFIEQVHLIENRWKQVGYRRLYMLDGTFFDWTKDNGDMWVDSNEITNGVAGFNGVSQHWCLAGGKGALKTETFLSNFTAKQYSSLVDGLKEFLKVHPDIIILGHYQATKSGKNCPGFDVPNFLKEIGIPEKNYSCKNLI